MNRYSYVLNNPIRLTDPTGHIAQGEEKDAERLLRLLGAFDVRITVDWGLKKKKWQEGLWSLSELQTILDSVTALAGTMGGLDAFKANLGGVTITQKHINEAGLGDAHNITLCDAGFTSWTVVHELAHAWDGANDWQLSKSMETSLGSGFDHPLLHTLSPKDPRYWWDPGQGPPPCGVDGGLNRLEDFAESITAYVYPTEASKRATARGWPYVDKARGYSYSSYLDTPRGLYIGARFGFTP